MHVDLTDFKLFNIYVFVHLQCKKKFNDKDFMSVFDRGPVLVLVFIESFNCDVCLFDIVSFSLQLSTECLPHELLNPAFLNNALNKAFGSSLKGDSILVKNFGFALQFIPPFFKQNGMNNSC